MDIFICVIIVTIDIIDIIVIVDIIDTINIVNIIVIIIRPEFWSVDPYARIYPISFGFKLPMTMLGSQVIIMTMLGSEVIINIVIIAMLMSIATYNSHYDGNHTHDHQPS